MRFLTTTARMAIGLASITLGAVLFAGMLGLIPDRNEAVMEGRARLCESAGISFTLLANREDFTKTRLGLEAIARRNPELITAAVRAADGEIVARAGDHENRWNAPATKDLPGSQMLVPIMFNGEAWGAIEFCFEPLEQAGWLGIWAAKELRLPIFMTLMSGLGAWLYLRRVLRYLDPSKVVPARVRQALDTLAEGLLLLDKDERIVLANRAFTQTAGIDEKNLLGCKASSLPWLSATYGMPMSDLPWQGVLRGEEPRSGVMLNFKPVDDEPRTFMVNAAPILDDHGNSQGALTSFGDVTPLERKKVELDETLSILRRSAEEIGRQNKELERLATQDPLTGCWNRRSFFAVFDELWNSTKLEECEISCMMVDLDYFKSINDRFGHSAGDEVLRKVADSLRQAARNEDFLCRYGGEEFCVMMRDTDIELAKKVAERFRQTIAALQFPQLTVTASFGISSRSLGAHTPQELLDEADKCLYVAKQQGRNCVISFADIPSDLVVDHSQVSRTKPLAQPAAEQSIPFHAVTALISALAFRDLTTAEHSRRVADLSIHVAEGLMSPSQCYLLEIAALLHDIGKLGVPDAVLLKPGPLSHDERELMRTHQRLGIELIRASFKSSDLCAILDHRDERTSEDSSGLALPHVHMASRILAIADSFDSMITEQAYRQARTPDEAFAELRRCAGTQFDAELVERFVTCTRARGIATIGVGEVTQEAALAIGRHVEHLVSALGRRDLNGLRDIAGHMNLVATKQGALTIAQHAADLESSLNSEESDLLAVLHEAEQLVQLCRQTQRACVDAQSSNAVRNTTHSHDRQSSYTAVAD